MVIHMEKILDHYFFFISIFCLEMSNFKNWSIVDLQTTLNYVHKHRHVQKTCPWNVNKNKTLKCLEEKEKNGLWH